MWVWVRIRYRSYLNNRCLKVAVEGVASMKPLQRTTLGPSTMSVSPLQPRPPFDAELLNQQCQQQRIGASKHLQATDRPRRYPLAMLACGRGQAAAAFETRPCIAYTSLLLVCHGGATQRIYELKVLRTLAASMCLPAEPGIARRLATPRACPRKQLPNSFCPLEFHVTPSGKLRLRRLFCTN